MILLLSLAMLAGLSLLAVLAASSMVQQRLMAANHSDGELARISAISAVAAGEQLLLGLANDSRSENCSSDCFIEPFSRLIQYRGILPAAPEFQPDDWWLQWGHDATASADPESDPQDGSFAWTLPGRQSPRFVIEEVHFLPVDSTMLPAEAPAISGVAYYRIIGRGTGLADNSTHVAESILARPWPAVGVSDSVVNPFNCSLFKAWYDCGRMAFRERR